MMLSLSTYLEMKLFRRLSAGQSAEDCSRVTGEYELSSDGVLTLVGHWAGALTDRFECLSNCLVPLVHSVISIQRTYNV